MRPELAAGQGLNGLPELVGPEAARDQLADWLTKRARNNWRANVR